MSFLLCQMQPIENGNFAFSPCRSKLGMKSLLLVPTCLPEIFRKYSQGE